MPDPYETLGVSKTASAEEIRKAFRSKAKKYHPDLHPGDKEAEAKFKAANAANDLLSDPEKRAQFDRGEIDAEGQPRMDRAFYRDYAQGPAGRRYRPGAGGEEGFSFNFGQGGANGGPDMEDLGDLFGSMFREQANRPRRGRDRSYRLEVPFLDTVTGATERLTLPDGQTLDVRIPPGLEDGQVLRLRGKGEPGGNGAPDGDALIEISVRPHPVYRREGAHLAMDLPVTLREAVLGAKIAVPTPHGRVTLSVPPRSDTGTRLRLRGRGIAARGSHPAGDLYAVLKLVSGPVDEKLESFLRTWEPPAGPDPRAALERDA